MRTIVVLLLGAVQWLCACSSKPAMEGGAGAGASVRETGVLRSGFVGIGGEHTGWVFQPEGGASAVEADVSRVAGAAGAGDGKRVRVTGSYEDRPYVERGRTRVLVVTAIEPAPAK